MKPHMAAQAALVRMIYDPSFAAVVQREPRRALPTLSVELADALGAVDPRALRRDSHRRERTLGQLCAELPCATTLAIAESGRMGLLLDFYGSTAFHGAIEVGASLVLALGTYLEERLADGSLRSAHLAAVLSLELASARARRGGEEPAGSAPPPLDDAQRLRRARGVEAVEVPTGALATLQVVEAHRFRLGLLPAWAFASDPPALPPLPSLGPLRSALVALALGGQVSLVEVEAPLLAVLTSLPAPRRARAIVDEAALRLGGDRERAQAALHSLIEDELIVAA